VILGIDGERIDGPRHAVNKPADVSAALAEAKKNNRKAVLLRVKGGEGARFVRSRSIRDGSLERLFGDRALALSRCRKKYARNRRPHIFKRPRLPRATCLSPPRENRGAFLLR